MGNTKIIKNLGMAGGGIHGYAEVAVLKEMENYKEYFDIKNISGTSVGSIVAALYAVGYKPDELLEIIFEMNFDKLIRDGYFAYFKLYEKFGMYEANLLEEEIERLISVKTNIKLCTFCQIKMNLTIVATNLNYQRPMLFNRDTTPHMPISHAIRMSIGYPGVMTPVEYMGDLFGDGGESINYPIIMYENLDETIGVTFNAHNENRDGTLKTRIAINSIYDYMGAIGNTMSRISYVSQISEKHLRRSVIVKITENINSMQFNLSKDQKKFIYECGLTAAREQLPEILGIDPKQNLELEVKIEKSDPKSIEESIDKLLDELIYKPVDEPFDEPDEISVEEPTQEELNELTDYDNSFNQSMEPISEMVNKLMGDILITKTIENNHRLRQ